MEKLLEKYPRAGKILKYGTAGFRDRAALPLDPTFVRMGMMAVARSRSCANQAVGVMITASHNPEPDNGLKLVDPDGGMLSQAWEPQCEALTNADSAAEALRLLQLLEEQSTEESAVEGQPTVYLARDTRPHSLALMGCVRAGVEAAGGVVRDLGEAATPLLHFAVASANGGGPAGAPAADEQGNWSASLTHAHYYHTLAKGFADLMSTTGVSAAGSAPAFSVVLDASFGVGSLAVEAMVLQLAAMGAEGLLSVDLRNKAGDGPVNEGCGAELVQKGLVPPCGVSAGADAGKTLVSFDGDADRVVFHTFLGDSAEGDGWTLLDGDKIACLLAESLQTELQAAGMGAEHYSLGAVQTAYANGAASDYLRAAGVPVVMAKTGVKHVHHKALQFDCGVYFEANGHGTVLFSEKLVKGIGELEVEGDSRAHLAAHRLRALLLAINSSVGDALSDAMVALACLAVRGWTLQDWIRSYTDYPSRQLKLAVQNKSLITCSEDETTALSPPALPVALAAAAAKVKQGRCFVRPSGTEDVVRVYAEAADREAADALAQECIAAIKSALGEE